MNLIKRYRVKKYKSKLTNISQDIANLEVLKKEIELNINLFDKKIRESADVKRKSDGTSMKATIENLMNEYQASLINFQKKYIRWYYNCIKLNSGDWWNDEYEDVYSNALIKHKGYLTKFKTNINSLFHINFTGKSIMSL